MRDGVTSCHSRRVNVAALVEAGGGLAARADLLARGVSSAALSRAVAAGEVVRIAPGVYRRGDVRAFARLRAATLATGGCASHDSAAAMWGWTSSTNRVCT